ncbi:MAG: hypothetical protein G3M78_01945 [Candidatus Nitrohelix vancouverensis]|uniref:Uncharacterized protein n=1 Tax=Candidatus Nitrohelix vancouverensis TaxID=2705534 RepID=A0A7T0C0D1_9BACT|nr:MAG: hypothetical protein G3M78_01945 [Candidatus Nitrohelix vancouverensis]
MNEPLAPSGLLVGDDNLINLYYLNELYGKIARHVSGEISHFLGHDIPITSGIWGGTYLIADPTGKCRRRVWRLYSIVNLPQNTPLDEQKNLERLIEFYFKAYISAFKPYDMELDLKMWGGKLPYGCKEKPSFTMHMEDANKRVNWLRCFFVWNQASWEESVIYDLVRIIKEYKQYFNFDRGKVVKDAKDLKYILQDVIIIYRTLEKACHPDFVEHAEPIIADLTQHFMKGLHDAPLIQSLYEKVYDNALIYGYEQALEGPYQEAGLDIRKIEHWPVEKINWVPDALVKSLAPPITQMFEGFRKNLGIPQAEDDDF